METTARMDVERATEELTERKVVRRGLLAGIATFAAAAAVKVTGAGKAEATNGNSVVIGDVTQTATSTTRLVASGGFDLPVFAVNNGTAGYGGNRTGLIGTVGGNANSWG